LHLISEQEIGNGLFPEHHDPIFTFCKPKCGYGKQSDEREEEGASASLRDAHQTTLTQLLLLLL
jgi:hypothetical protein